MGKQNLKKSHKVKQGGAHIRKSKGGNDPQKHKSSKFVKKHLPSINPSGKPSKKGNQQGIPAQKKKMIKRDKNGKARIATKKAGQSKNTFDKKKIEERDLDRELRDYWITQRGVKRDDPEAKEFVKAKLDSEMEEYWKNKQ